jgi:phytoene synthase
MADAFDHCEELVRAGDRDRYLATLFAPQKYRRALYALYAFNLEVARTRELAREPMPGEIRLQFWRDALAGQGEAHPVAASLRDAVVRYRLPPQALLDLIDAREFDLYDEPMASLGELERYVQRTSSALMALAARILIDGQDADMIDPIGSAGAAYGVAGLLQAFPIHAARGQIFVPLDVLGRYGAQVPDVMAGKDSTPLRAALAELRLRARQHLAAAQAALGSAPPQALPALLPVALVRPALDPMERGSYRPFQPAALAPWRRQWALWRGARSDLRSAF